MTSLVRIFKPSGDLAATVDQRSPVARYNFDVFKARGIPQDQLDGTPYRYWHSHAIAYIFARKLSGDVDVLDAGGRDGGTLRLLKNLGLRGSYTCLDRAPRMKVTHDPEFEIDIISSAFEDFSPRRSYDAVLFQTCLECVKDFSEIAWLARCLKPGGFALATLHCRNTRRLYKTYRYNGGLYPLDEPELGPAFSRIGMRIVELFPLGGAASRLCQSLTRGRFAQSIGTGVRAGTGLASSKIGDANLIGGISHVLNPLAARLDRAFRFWRIGHCIVVERAETWS